MFLGCFSITLLINIENWTQWAVPWQIIYVNAASASYTSNNTGKNIVPYSILHYSGNYATSLAQGTVGTKVGLLCTSSCTLHYVNVAKKELYPLQ